MSYWYCVSDSHWHNAQVEFSRFRFHYCRGKNRIFRSFSQMFRDSATLWNLFAIVIVLLPGNSKFPTASKKMQPVTGCSEMKITKLLRNLPHVNHVNVPIFRPEIPKLYCLASWRGSWLSPGFNFNLKGRRRSALSLLHFGGLILRL